MKNLQKIIYITAAAISLSVVTQAKAQIVISEVEPAGSSSSTSHKSDWFELTSGVAIAGVTFGAAPTESATFDNTVGTNGPISTASDVGTNGALTSVTGGEIGLPRVAASVVPERSAYALMLGGFITLIAINKLRRRDGVISCSRRSYS
jgi:hypothetical protein